MAVLLIIKTENKNPKKKLKPTPSIGQYKIYFDHEVTSFNLKNFRSLPSMGTRAHYLHSQLTDAHECA